MTIQDLQKLLPSDVTVKPINPTEDEIIYHLWFVGIDAGDFDINSKGDITAVNIKKQYKSEIENNAKVNKVLKENNLTIQYV